MRYLPIWLDVKDYPCLMVGGGEVASRKSEMLLKAGASLTVVAPTLCKNLQASLERGDIEHRAKHFEADDVQGCRLVVAATDDECANRRVYEAAKSAGVMVNVVDTPELCDYTNGAVVERDPITIAISSGGGAPVLARAIKARLETLIPAAYGQLAALVKSYRKTVKARVPFEHRRSFWEGVLSGPVAEAVLAGQTDRADQLLQQAIDDRVDSPSADGAMGEVYLIGAGPGDPDLLTFKALRLLQQADVVVHDRLIPEAVMNLCRREAERVYVGKLAADHSVPQGEISQLLVDYAKQGLKVARLKGGDSFMFGRGGEEIALLAENAVPFQVVPGVTSASGCGAYAGIPLTHRDHAQACVFVTGHTRDDSLDHLNWPQLAQPRQTVVFYMGLKNIAEICRRLQEEGAPSDRPAAIVEQGTTPAQRVVIGNLTDLPERARKAEVKAPALIMVGDVVLLQQQFAWFEPSHPGASAFRFRHKL
ncbi:siroheme synthase [gamma proteobacterium HTCC5015]|nr:siroheme synthase [gamma proteobacterium HTCC5015]